MFVLYICSVFLAPAANKSIDFNISNAFLDVYMIGKYNWYGYVFYRLCDAVNQIKSECKNKELRKSVSGCILLLAGDFVLPKVLFRGQKSPWENTSMLSHHAYC